MININKQIPIILFLFDFFPNPLFNLSLNFNISNNFISFLYRHCILFLIIKHIISIFRFFIKEFSHFNLYLFQKNKKVYLNVSTQINFFLYSPVSSVVITRDILLLNFLPFSIIPILSPSFLFCNFSALIL